MIVWPPRAVLRRHYLQVLDAVVTAPLAIGVPFCSGPAGGLVSASIEANVRRADNRRHPTDLASPASSFAICLTYASVNCVFASTFVSFALRFGILNLLQIVINNDHPMIIQREIVILYPLGLQRMSQIRYERKIIFGG